MISYIMKLMASVTNSLPPSYDDVVNDMRIQQIILDCEQKDDKDDTMLRICMILLILCICIIIFCIVFFVFPT